MSLSVKYGMPALKLWALLCAVAGLSASGCGRRAELSLAPPPEAVAFSTSRACDPLTHGEIRYAYGTLPTGVPVSYRIEKSADPEREHFRVFLNLHFDSRKEESGRRVMKETLACLKALNPHLKGPNGETLSIEVDHFDRKLRVLGLIKLEELEEMEESERSKFREYSYRWSTQLECGQIFHEVLHHLGLVDEYWDADYRCRAGGPNTSPMVSGKAAMMSALPGLKPAECACPETEGEERERCLATLAVSDPPKDGEACPAGSIERPVPALSSPPNPKAVERGAGWIRFARAVAPRTDSLLMPAHFRAITLPGCESANRIYYQCAKAAYVTHENACPKDLPAECGNPEEWLR